MTHVYCPECRLRFTPAAAAYLDACPECGERLRASSLRGTVGFRLLRLEDVPHPLPRAVAASIPVPEPDRARP